MGRGATSAALLLWSIERDWTLARGIGVEVQGGLWGKPVVDLLFDNLLFTIYYWAN